MHTYHEVRDGYEVTFETSSDVKEIRKFPTEDEAAAYVSYLNGGTHPGWMRLKLAYGIQRRT